MVNFVKKMSERCQISVPHVGPAHCRRTQRRAPATPPLPLRSLQLVPNRPETPVVFRDHRKVRVRGPGARDSWPGAGASQSRPLAPAFSGQTITEAWTAPSGQVSSISQNLQVAAPPHPHWSAPVRAPTVGGGSEATMTSLLLFCHR